MNELDYLDDVNENQKRLEQELSTGIKEINDFYRANEYRSNHIPPVILTHLQQLKTHTFNRYNEKDRATWELVPNSSQYGAWFDNAPLEIAPRSPHETPSQTFISLIENMSDWCIKDHQIDHLTIFNTLFDEKTYYQANTADRMHRQWLALYLLSLSSTPWERDCLYQQSHHVHSDPHIRALVLSLAFFDLPWVPAETYLYGCTHDTDEVVFIKAFRVCSSIHDERAMDHLRPIVQSPSAVLEGLHDNNMYYPVGHAACNICPAQFSIIGTDNPALAKKREAELSKRLRRPLSVPVEHQRENLLNSIKNYKEPTIEPAEPNDLDKMVKIPAGEFIFGIDQEKVRNEVFDWSTCSPTKTMHLEEFYIDPYPVTNEQYDNWESKFNKLKVKDKKQFEHPGQKPGKTHRRNTFDDPRFKADHPVVGIDWFDAWAFARYHNKELPTEYQWEKAAKGQTNWKYPWGDLFDPGALRFAGETYKVTPSNIVEWIILLNKGTRSFPDSTTTSVYAHPTGISPTGVYDMCGNAWEFTKTSFFTGNNARLPFADYSPIELMGTREGHVAIRGGAWSSPAPLIGASYRGYDLLTDRHTEISFRCIFNPNSDQER